MRELESVIQGIIAFSGRFGFREDVLLHIKLEDAGDDTSWKSLPALWDSIHAINRGEWPTMAEVRDWYVQQAYCDLGKESAVARQLGMDIRTVNSILLLSREVARAGRQNSERIEQISCRVQIADRCVLYLDNLGTWFYLYPR